MKTLIFAPTLLWLSLLHWSAAAGVPKIEFVQTTYNFPKTAEVSVVGTFKFKNAGDGILQVEQPTASCGCTSASLTKGALKPGEMAEVSFTLTLRGLKGGTLSKTVRVVSNDPAMPISILTITGDYAPLYEAAPLTLQAEVPRGGTKGDLLVNLTRTDGKPVQIQRLETSKPWIVAKVEPGSNPAEASARIRVEVQGGEMARRFSEFISVYAGEKSDGPVARVSVLGRVKGELTVTPERVFWSITDPTKQITELPEVLTTRRLTIRSSSGKGFELKNPLLTMKEVNVEMNALPDGTGYEVVARLVEVPQQTLAGSIIFATSVASDPEVQIPVSIRVVQRNATTVPRPATVPIPGKAARAIDPAGDAAPPPPAVAPAPAAPPK